MSQAGHNIEGERERLVAQVKLHEGEAQRFGRQSVESGYAAGVAMLKLRQTYGGENPPGFRARCEQEGLSRGHVDTLLRRGLYGPKIHKVCEFSTLGAFDTACLNKRDEEKAKKAEAEREEHAKAEDEARRKAAAAQGEAERQAAEAEADEAHGKAVRAAVRALKADEARALRSSSEVMARADDPIVAGVLHKAGTRYYADRPRSNEWYTPQAVIDAARATMGGIDLDPASCEAANEIVQAATWYAEGDDGLSKPWTGRIWLNPPYSSGGKDCLAAWMQRAREAVASGEAKELILLVHNVPDTKAGHPALRECAAACFTAPRLKFHGPDGHVPGAMSTGQMILLYSMRAGAVDDFGEYFSAIGTVVVPWRAP